MSRLSDFYKQVKENDLSFFFGDTRKKSNKYFEFKHYIDDDNIVIVTSNLKEIKESPCLLVNNNQAVFLKEWQVRKVHNYYDNIYAYAIKLNRKYFKIYTFQKDFEEYFFDKLNDFDYLIEVAKSQDEENMMIALGW